MILFIIVLLAIGIISIKTENTIANPITILYTIWGIILYNSYLQFYTLYSTSQIYYKYISVGLISFGLVYFLLRIFFKKKYFVIKSNKGNSNCKYRLKKNLCLVLSIICVLVLVIRLMQNREILFRYGYNLASVQKVLQETETEKSGIFNAISFLLINPLFLALTVSLSVNYILGDKDRKLLIILILMTILRVITTGGRQAFIQLFFIILVCMSFRKNNVEKNKIKIKNNLRNIAIFSTGIIVLLLLTLSRTQSIVKTIYLDFAMQPYMFENWGNYIDDNSLCGYGVTFMIGFIYPIFYIVKNIFGINMPVLIENIYLTTMKPIEEWIYIGKTLKANAYVSIFWYFYLDGGLLAIIIEMIIISFISFNRFQKAKSNSNLRNVSLYIMIALSIFYSFGDFEFAKPNFAIAYIFLGLIIFEKVKVENEN